ncbi:MAG: PD-(D/E)XK nuclease family transposase [Bacteroidales bacterium]|nr:PD-(D/E)XK nuclease family transposase [Bacteroidales bacterium]
MNNFKERYINPFTDFGFKRLFGEEPNKDLLLDFLNELLKEEQGRITDLLYLPNEKLPLSVGDRRAIFDIYCTNEKGEQFIVEMQKAEQKFFKDRTIYYSTFPIQEQARSKDRFWNFELKAIYTIGILDFSFDESDTDKYRHDVKLTEQETKDVFYNKLTYIYLEMPKFLKTEKELETRFDKWMFVLKNLPKLDRIPVGLKEKIFLKLFETAEIAKLEPDEYKQYEASVNAYRDIFNIKNTYWEKGKMEEKIEVAKKLIKSGVAIEIIINATGLSEKDINNLNLSDI